MGKNVGLISELKGKLQKAFENDISEGEEIIVKLHPSAQGEAIVVTERRVIIIKAGLIAGAGAFGARSKSFYFNQITSVDLRIGITGGHLQLTVAGSVESKDSSFSKMIEAENAITFTGQYKEIMKKVAEIIREKIHTVHTTTVQVATTSDKAAFIQELKELAELKQQGILTEEEFQSAKAKLLN